MTSEDWDRVKAVLTRLREVTQELWLEKQLLWNHIIDSEWMTEAELDAAIAQGKDHPANIQQMQEVWTDSEQSLAELGLEQWLADFEKRHPRSD